MMRTILCCVLLSVSAAFGQDPLAATITGPTGGVPGDILILDASASPSAKAFAWSSVPKNDDKDRPTIYPIEGGTKCIVCSRPGTYTIILAVSSAEGQLSVTQWVMVVDGQPAPGPKPKPPMPTPSLTGLAKTAYDAAMRVDAAHRGTAAALADSFENVAAAISAGGIKGENEIKIETAKANVEALGGPSSKAALAWVPWFTSIKSDTERLSGDEAHAQAWRDIAKGLKAVR